VVPTVEPGTTTIVHAVLETVVAATVVAGTVVPGSEVEYLVSPVVKRLVGLIELLSANATVTSYGACVA
jgi:hypothetical protein